MQNVINNKLLHYHRYKVSSLLTYVIIEKADFLITKIGQHVIRFYNIQYDNFDSTSNSLTEDMSLVTACIL